ncbi:MAG TPA: DEAD/DEAH box helicase, partial [Clostridiaceae bacterium]
TDVAARGIDVEDISHVINYDLPQDTESYVHRIGRTGRANKEGIAYSLVTPREYVMLKQIEKYTKSKIKRKEIPTIDEIFESKYKSILTTVKDSLEKEDYKDFIPVATELDEEYNLVDVAAALMKMYFSRELSFEYKDNNITGGGKVRLFLSIGRIDNIEPKKLLRFISDNIDLDTAEIGDIDILNKFTFIDVPERFVDVMLKKVSGKKFHGRRVNIEIATGKTK